MLWSFQDLEIQLQTESEALHDQVRSLEDQLSTEKQRREDAEQENTKQKQVKNNSFLIQLIRK